MLKAVIFDCFGVLYVDNSQAFYQKYVERYDELLPKLKELNAQLDYGLISELDWREQITSLTGLDRGLVDREIGGDYKRNQPIIDYIQQLRSRGILVAMLSNVGSGAMDSFFSQDERHDLFDTTVLSSDVMLTKPHPEVYRLTAEQLDVEVSECLMIDDSADNCAGADAAGMRSVLYESNQQVKREINILL